MPISMRETIRAVAVQVTDSMLVVDLEDGRVLQVPLEWFPTLLKASVAARQDVRLVGRGIGLHWPDLDEDLSISGLLRGQSNAGQHVPDNADDDADDDADDGDNESPANGSPVGRYARPEVP